MNIDWSPEEAAFCEEVRQFLKDKLTDEIRAGGKLMTSVYADHDISLKWQKILHTKGWAAPSWPVEYGGCDWTVAQHYIFAREKAIAGAPPLSPMGIQMCAPALIQFGTEEQKKYFLPRMLNGEDFWCQGYSEPGSGSDLASLKMPAIVDGDDFICNGSKIWTTHADISNWIFCLVRTSKLDKPQKGITFLLIDMSTPGIEVKPILSSSGEHIQNEVFFTNVRVPIKNTIGEIDDGWTVAKYLLEFERGGAAYAPLIQARLTEINNLAKTNHDPLIKTPLFSAKLASAFIKASALEMYELRSMSMMAQGHSPGASASVMKILGTELQQLVTELSVEACGDYAHAYQPHATKPGGDVSYPSNTSVNVGSQLASLASLRYFNERAGSIYAGSNEIQRNILSKVALGI